jgi:hypothetical protein
MTRTLHSLALALALLPACLEDRDLLAPVAQARGELVAEEAQPAARAALGMAALGAALCGYSLEDWQAMGETPELPEELGAWFSIDGPGVIKGYPARGQYDLTWSGASFFGQDVTLAVTVATPMSAFTVSLNEPGGAADTGADTGAGLQAGQPLAAAVLSTSSCGGEQPQVAGSLSFPISGDYAWAVELKPAEDDDGLVFDPGTILPLRGGLGWSGTTDLGRASLQTDDASLISDGAWPATAAGRRWEARVSLELD